MSVPYDPERITYMAETDYRNQRARFGIKSRDRTRHMYVIGKSGVGKSTLLENMAMQDIDRGEGITVLDPHGSFAEKMLDYVPAHRIKDVIYFAPFDTEYPISFNILEDVGPGRRHFVASGLMSTFKKIWVDAWSARMEYILNNILLALLEYPDATILGVNRMLADKDFRNKVVDKVTDPGVKAFWTDEFAKYGERYMQEAGAAIQNKIGQFVANPLIRNMMGQPKTSFDLRDAMDKQKILIINLSKGRIGEQNTSLLGSMIITKIYLAAMSRADASPGQLADLPNFYFYVDEFQSFANETFADILSEARKYKLALIIAHQYIAQMEEPVRDAVFGNVGTSVSFRVGPLDAELLEKAFAPQFTQNDLINLGMPVIFLSLVINNIVAHPSTASTIPPLPRPAISYRNDVIEWSRQEYASPREGVEIEINKWYATDKAAVEERPQKQIRFADGKPPAAYDKGNKAPFRPQERSQERPSQPPRKQDPQMEKPFAKAFAKQIEPDPTAEKDMESPGLKALLNSLSLEKEPQNTNPSVQKERETAPFSGEKTLKESIPPVKIAERGPTEKNREMLKALLLKTQNSNPGPSVQQPAAPHQETVAGPQIQNPQQKPAADVSVQKSQDEISYHALQKVLE